MKQKKSIPKKDEYKIKYIFKENSNIDLNEIIKKCFITKLKTIKT